ncbi:MAG: L-threonylcarbamoyladenylate synthase [bacterium]
MYEPDEDVVIRASREIILGGIVIMPTDTIYGFHASPFCMDALNRIIKLKQMTEKKPFIMLIPSPKILKWLGIEFKRWQIEFLIRIWPGPVSVIMKSICSYPMPISDEGWICFRVPDNILVNNIIRRIGFSIISTSANISGFEPLKEPQVLIEKFLNNVELILDGGIVKDERPSTIIKLLDDDFIMVREGRVSEIQLREVLRGVR